MNEARSGLFSLLNTRTQPFQWSPLERRDNAAIAGSRRRSLCVSASLRPSAGLAGESEVEGLFGDPFPSAASPLLPINN